MCFKSTEYAKARRAKTDIECFKTLKNKRSYESSIKNFSYKKGVITPLVKIQKNKHLDYKIYEGYHSYHSILDAKNNWNYNMFLHKICKFVIPAGTRYYSNNDGEYVSEQIKLIGNIKI